MAELKTYLFDKTMTNRYLSPKHEARDKDGKPYMVRLVKGDSELDMKKQSPNAEPIAIYISGRLYTTDNPTHQEFLESRKDFGSKITIYDPLSKNKEQLAKKKNYISLLKDIALLPEAEIKAIGYDLFGRKSIELIKAGDFDGLHGDILEYAGEQPEKVYEIINNPKKTDRRFTALLIATGVLNVSIDNRFVTWGDNDVPIYTTPNGVDVLDGLVDYFQTKEGKEVKKEAGLRLENITQNKVTKKATETAQAKADEKAVEADTEVKEEVKIIEKKGRFGRMEKVKVPIDNKENEGK